LPAVEGESANTLPHRVLSNSTGEVIDRREKQLASYQNQAYADRFRTKMERVQKAEEAAGGKGKLAEIVGRNLFKLMAIKDEYEVARLYSDGAFLDQLKDQFDGWDSLEFHLAPPLFSKRDDQGKLVKSVYGPWMMKAYGLLARLKGLRGGAFDVFGYTAERKMERRLLGDYEVVVEEIIDNLSAKNMGAAAALAAYPELIRGYGHVKELSVKKADAERMALRAGFKNVDGLSALEAAE